MRLFGAWFAVYGLFDRVPGTENHSTKWRLPKR